MTPPTTPEATENQALEQALREAFRALAPVAEGLMFAPESRLDVDALADELRQVADWVLDFAYVVERGARYGWKTKRDEDDWTPEIFAVNLDRDRFGDYDRDNWSDTPLHSIARAYRHEAGWDFSPGQSGVWLFQAAPTSKIPTSEGCWATGNIVAFAVLRDRDEDGAYESLAHVWTARGWRRQGLASGLLAHAREHYALRDIEGPATDDGLGLIRARLLDLLEVAEEEKS